VNRTPVALYTALPTAAGTGPAPDSPAPFCPPGIVTDGAGISKI
jgi:hypothetical protein